MPKPPGRHERRRCRLALALAEAPRDRLQVPRCVVVRSDSHRNNNVSNIGNNDDNIRRINSLPHGCCYTF